MKIVKLTFIVLFLTFFKNFTFGQNPGDTIVVNTFNYNMTYGVGNRDTVVSFPDLPGVKFEKILMEYNMRCKNALVSTGSNTNLGCGEWDYSCNTYLHDSSRVDSLKYTTSSHSISGFSGTNFSYTNTQPYDYYQYTQQAVVLNGITSENQYPVLTGITPSSDALAGTNTSGKSQYLYTASELVAAGLTAGNIDGFLLNALNGGTVHFLSVKIKSTTATFLDSSNVSTVGFSEVFNSNFNFITGPNRIQFFTPFVWNGTDNIIIEFSFTNTLPGADIQLTSTVSALGLGLTTNNGYFQDISGNGHIDVPAAAMSSITNEVTVSFWAFGDPGLLPANTTLIEGLDPNGARSLNVHLPWSNSDIYWDCGNVGSSYDRINKPATSNEISGQWNHWSFVKNATTGVMQIYLNGTLWHFGTSKTRPMDIASLIIGKSGNLNNNYRGSIDELSIWNKALTGSEIQDWMNLSLNSNHPQYTNLVAYYPFNEGTGSSYADLSSNGAVATGNGLTVWRSIRGNDLNRFFHATGFRPSLTLVNGSYNTTITQIQVMDSVAITPNTVNEYIVVPHPGTLLDDEVVSINSYQVWESIPQNIYNAYTGAVIGTIPVNTDGTIIPTVLTYIRRWPMKFEIMSFVTPYGINLNLGPNGKTWTFDMTDYSPILKGSKRITMERGGQWQEDMDIKFLFIVGTPYRDVLDIREVWRTESRPYTTIISDQYFEPIDVPTLAAGNAFKVRTSVSGHGQEGEFIPQNHFLNVNGGSVEFNWQVWKECAENPVYPQGGTWIYDRAGWCPGMATDVEQNDISSLVTPGMPVNLDYGVSTASGVSNYIVSNQLVTYGPINKALDAAIVGIRQPSDKVEYERFNVICSSPKATLKNMGSSALTNAKIKYWVNDAAIPNYYFWSGSLLTGQEIEITLPSSYELWVPINATGNIFHVEVENPNNGTDEYVFNNHFRSSFNIPAVMPSNIIVEFRTNSFPNENGYQIVDDQNNVVLSRSGMSANTLYKDTLNLPMGCYSYKVTDSDDDGISFWANNDGPGYTRFRQVGGPVLVTFKADFGNNINYNFTVLSALSNEELAGSQDISVFPNPTSNELNLALRNFDAKVEIVLIDNLGKIVQSNTVTTSVGGYNGKINISSLPDGLYMMKVSDGRKTSVVKVIKN